MLGTIFNIGGIWKYVHKQALSDLISKYKLEIIVIQETKKYTFWLHFVNFISRPCKFPRHELRAKNATRKLHVRCYGW